MKAEFQIYKKNTTVNGKVTILSKEGEVFNKTAKIGRYKATGYDVFDMNNNKL